MSEQISGKTDGIDQRVPVDIQPAERQPDKRFELRRVWLFAGVPVTLRFPVLPDTYMIVRDLILAGDVYVNLGPNVDAAHRVIISGIGMVRLPGVDHFVTLLSTNDDVVVVIAEAGYPQLDFSGA